MRFKEWGYNICLNEKTALDGGYMKPMIVYYIIYGFLMLVGLMVLYKGTVNLIKGYNLSNKIRILIELWRNNK